MTCEDCTNATGNTHYLVFNPACLYCGARYLRAIRRRPMTRQAVETYQTHILDSWARYGHNPETIRQMARDNEWPCGPARSGASEPRSPRKRR